MNIKTQLDVVPFYIFGSVNNNEDEQDEKDKGATRNILKKESSNKFIFLDFLFV